MVVSDGQKITLPHLQAHAAQRLRIDLAHVVNFLHVDGIDQNFAGHWMVRLLKGLYSARNALAGSVLSAYHAGYRELSNVAANDSENVSGTIHQPINP